MRQATILLSKKLARAAAFGVIFCMLFCSAGMAAEEAVATQEPPKGLFPPSPWTADKTYADKTAHKLGFGFLNITAGWMALLYEPLKGKYFFDGLGRGALYAVTNTAGGILHAVTFPAPVDIPLLNGGISYEYRK